MNTVNLPRTNTGPEPSLRAPGRLRAFTLIELLTVIAIIGILAAILIPVVGKVRASARSSVCASNLRQVSIALTGYVTEHRGQLPGFEKIRDNTGYYYDMGREASPRWWMEGSNLTRGLAAQLLPYFTAAIPWSRNTGVVDILACPANEATADTLGSTSTVPSYMLGLRVKTISGTFRRPFAYAGSPSLHTSDIAAPRDAVMMFDIDTEFATRLGTATSAKAIPTSAHGSTRNVLYFDGHVGTIARDIDPHEKP